MTSPYLALDRSVAVNLRQDERGEIQIHIQAGVFEAGLGPLFETSVIEAFRARLEMQGS